MKKIMLIFAAMAVVFASCSKSELESESVNGSKEYVLDIDVAAPGADADTKALIKTDWAPADNIKVWFDEKTQDYIVITYSGSKWELTSGTIPQDLKNSGGKIKALYKGGVIVAATEGYTVTNEGDKNVVRFYINSWKFLTEIQVVVTDIPNTMSKVYLLQCDQFKALTGDEYNVGESGITAVQSSDWNTAVLGSPNQDGYAFVFGTANYSSGEQTYKFTLKDVINNKEYTYSVKKSDFTQETNSSKIKALKISFSKFAVPTKGTAKATIGGIEVDVNWVQLWAGGPKFAEMNLGATSATEVGDTYPFSATSANDKAATTWGEKWRIPSKDQMNELLKAATSEPNTKVECNYINENGVDGFKFTGLTDGYTGNSVFFPAQSGGSYGIAGYWSGTVNESEDSKAWLMVLVCNSGVWAESGWASNPQNGVCLVRPVLKN